MSVASASGDLRYLTICVSYRNHDETVRFLDDLFSLSGYETGAAVVVVNDGLPSLREPRLDRLCGEHDLLSTYPKTNLGYLNGAHHGLQYFLRTRSLPDWIVVSNPDIDFPDPALFVKLQELYERESHVPLVIAPDIELISTGNRPSTRRHQNPYMWCRPKPWKIRLLSRLHSSAGIYAAYEVLTSIRWSMMYHIGHQRLPIPGQGRSRDALDPSLEYPTPIYAPFGAFFIFRREFFEDGGTLSGAPFLYGEEIYIAERVLSLGRQVVFDPRLVVRHREHGSVAGLESSERAKLAARSLQSVTDAFF